MADPRIYSTVAQGHNEPANESAQKIDAILADITEQVTHGQFTPKIFRYLATNEYLLTSTWRTCKDNLLSGNLPRLLKEMILITVSAEMVCQYCFNVHLAISKLFGISDAEFETLRHGLSHIEELEDEKTRWVLKFCVGLANSSESKLVPKQQLSKVGVSEDDIAEIISMVGFAAHMCMIAKGFGIQDAPDDESITLSER